MGERGCTIQHSARTQARTEAQGTAHSPGDAIHCSRKIGNNCDYHSVMRTRNKDKKKSVLVEVLYVVHVHHGPGAALER